MTAEQSANKAAPLMFETVGESERLESRARNVDDYRLTSNLIVGLNVG